MNQEEYMDLHSRKNDGWTNKEIAEEFGYHGDFGRNPLTGLK